MNQKGFTIIELLVVIVIIGILVALTLPNLFSAQARGRDTDRKNELKNLQQKLETYFNDNGGYPLTATWETDLGTSTDETEGPRADGYVYVSDGDTYTLTADLENDDDPDADASGNYVLNSVNQ
jgi:type II secretion system protein G